jgi:tripartite-type tricarboxylate transporter receptor subunit TctC
MIDRRTSLLALAATAFSGPGFAQPFPSKPLRVVVPFAAGGPADVVAREVGQLLGATFGQPVIVENQGGGAGVAALGAVARADADGHTLLLAASGNIVLQPQVSRTGGAELLAKLQPVALISTGPHVLVVSSKLPVKTLKEFIDYAKAHPGQLSYGSAGVGAVAHLGMEYLKSLAKVDLVHVPYKGTAAAIGDLTSGNIHAMFSSPPSLQAAIDKGYVRSLGMSAPGGTGPAQALPVIGTVVPGFEFNTWYAMYAPLATPQPVVASINGALRKVLSDATLKDKLAGQGVALAHSTPQELAQIMKRDTESWARVIRDTKITIE